MPFQLEDGSGLIVVESTGEIWLENDVASSGIKWPRCCCAPAVCTVRFNVKGCNSLNLENATVTIWTNSGKTSQVATGTTNSSGNVDLDVHSAGSYYHEVTTGGHFTVSSGTTTLTCNSTVNIALTAASGYVCCSQVAQAIPTTLHWTDSDTTKTLTYASGIWSVRYDGNVTVNPISNCPGGFPDCAGGDGNPVLTLSVACSSDNQVLISRVWYQQCGTSGVSNYLTSIACTTRFPAQSIAAYTVPSGAFSFSGTLTADSGNPIGSLPDPVGGTVTVTA